ncbi:MAG: SDR family oxidoreductase [Bacteroidota bacterium]
MNKPIMSRNVLILGAHSDIARAIAHQYAQEGAKLILAARNSKRLEADVSDLGIRYHVQADIVEFDALAYTDHLTFYESLSVKPDLVFCVFGYLGQQEVAEKEWSQAKEILEVNFLGAASVLHHIANDMESRKEGIIVGISSVAGERGRASNYLYGSGKAGFTALLSGLRNRLVKSGVHVLTVKPGFVATAMTEEMDLPPLLTSTPEKVARDIKKAVRKQKNVLYTKWMWRYIMLVIRHIPESIFKKLSL